MPGRKEPVLLNLVDIQKSYAVGPVTSEVLRGARLEVARGDLLSIMGPSGCGKSTLVNILGLLDRPTAGSYILDGRETSAMSDDERSDIRNHSVGFIFQSFYLLPRLTAWENVAVPMAYRGLSGSAVKRRALEMLDRVGMGDRSDYRPNQLSGGQQQRVAIARALVGEPAIVLADEPTGALDSDTGQEIMEMLVDLNATGGITVIIITHDRGIARQCRRQTCILDGLLQEEGKSGPPESSLSPSG